MAAHLHGPECIRTSPGGVKSIVCERRGVDNAIEQIGTIRPGDTVLIRVDPKTSTDVVVDLRDQLRDRLPEEVGVIVIACEDLAVLLGEELEIDGLPRIEAPR